MKQLILFSLAINIIFSSASASAEEYWLEQLTSNLGIPWGMTFIDNNQILFTERAGKAGILNTQTKQVTYLKGLPKIHVKQQGGLLDVVTSPNYKKDKWLYFTYSKTVNFNGVTVLARAKLNQYTLINWQNLLVTHSATDSNIHFGSRIAFDDKGYVYFSIGDRGIRNNSQNRNNHAGSIIRLHLDGTTPTDNPFVNDKNIKPQIWSYGHRNPQGMAWDNKNKRLWSIEHGPRGGDEINLIQKGKNYGWPIISYGKEYWNPFAVGEGTHKKGMQQPVKVYTPSIAPSSLLFYTGKQFPRWQGNLFTGALKLTHLNRVVIDKAGNAVKEERLLTNLNERIRAVIQSPAGEIIFSTDSGKIYKMVARSN